MCCGQKGWTYRPATPSARFPDPATARVAPRSRGAETAARFEYTGPTTLTVRGPLSGRTYVFRGHGAVLTVDPRDRAALAAVPGLRALRR
jgi:hypothetical protein